ncbi:hypothetical protein L596_001654 [Steinernema carpocapsae]|uniref:Uncharacterized protein n=1 Tax=Steinernema carpocapsae TaxID=34508 RepID=A0A4U8UMD6_STECR|nr:hypothetical protein L596_001654 [Steinernema carpocapsae]
MNFFVVFLTLTSALKLSFALSCFDHENVRLDLVKLFAGLRFQGAVTLLNSTGIKFCSIVSSLRGERPIQVALDENADLIERYNVFFAKQSELYEIDLLCFMEVNLLSSTVLDKSIYRHTTSRLSVCPTS